MSQASRCIRSREARSGIGSTARRSAGRAAAALFTVAVRSSGRAEGRRATRATRSARGRAAGADASGSRRGAAPDAGISVRTRTSSTWTFPSRTGHCPILAPRARRRGADGQGGRAGSLPELPGVAPGGFDMGSVLGRERPGGSHGERRASYLRNDSDNEATAGIEPAVVLTASGTVRYAADGGVEATASGGQCAKPIRGTPSSVTGCLNYQYAAAYGVSSAHPPCNWAIESERRFGRPGGGPGEDTILCMNLYTCIQQSGCWRRSGGNRGWLLLLRTQRLVRPGRAEQTGPSLAGPVHR